MTWERVKALWTKWRGHFRMQWGRLTDDHLDVIEGRREVLLGKLQETYGVTEAEAHRQVCAWENAEPERGGAARSPARSGPSG